MYCVVVGILNTGIIVKGNPIIPFWLNLNSSCTHVIIIFLFNFPAYSLPVQIQEIIDLQIFFILLLTFPEIPFHLQFWLVSMCCFA